MLLLLKVSLLLAAGLLIARVMRRTPASARHRLWSVVFVLLLALPALSAALPALAVPLWTASSTQTQDAGPAAPLQSEESHALPPLQEPESVTSPDTDEVTRAEPKSPLQMPGPLGIAAAIWAAGTLWAGGALLLGLWRVGRVRRRAVPLDDAVWRAAVAQASARFGLRQLPQVLMSDRVVTPMAGGLTRPTVFVPSDARAWDAERRDIVLAHEVAHLAGRDPLRQIVSRAVLAIYWFHPLAWLAARQAETAREQACDEAVIAGGTRPSAYARVLLEFADGLAPASPVFAALPIVQRSLLEKRLMAILSPDIRPRARRVVLLPALALVLFALPVAAARPVTMVATLDGEVPPARAAMLPPTTVPLTPPVDDTAAPVLSPAGEAAQAPTAALSSCRWTNAGGSSFHGSVTISDGVVTDRMGTGGSTRIIQRTFGDTRVCMLAENAGDRDIKPSAWPGAASRVVIETQRDSTVRTMIVRGADVAWSVDGVARPVDGEAEAWRARVLAVLDPAWELSTLRGEESSLRGEISSIHGERSSLQGEISSLYGEVSSMRGEISSIRGEESSLRGEISSIYGELSSLQGEISSERGQISSLSASRYDASDAERARIAERIKRHEAEIVRLERQVSDFDVAGRVAAVERRITALDANRKAEEMERRIRAFDVETRVRAVQERIAGLDVEGHVAEIERRIAALDADRRAREIEARLQQAVRALDR